MNKQKISSLLRDTLTKLATWKLFAGGMLLSNLALVFFLYQIQSVEKTIVMPPNFDRPFYIKGNEISPSYVEQMTQYFAQQRLTYNTKNAGVRFDSLLTFFSPSSYPVMQASFTNEARRIARNNISSVFHPISISIDGMVAIIEGELVGMIGSRIVSRKIKNYRFEYSYQNGIFSILSLEEVARASSGEFSPVEIEDGGGMVQALDLHDEQRIEEGAEL